MSFLKSFCLIVLTVILVVPVLAQEERGGRGRWERGREDRGREDRGDRERRRREFMRNWDPTDFLTRMDRDKNGFLDSKELDGRSRGFVENMGFDLSKPLAIKTIITKFNTDRGNRLTEERQKKLREDSLVPGFGEEMDLTPVADFSIDGPEPSLSSRYAEKIVNQVEEALKQFDQSGDRMLDNGERRRARLSSRIDTDEDDNLSPTELAEYYKRQDVENQVSENQVRGRPADSSASQNRSQRFGRNTTNQPQPTKKSAPKPSASNLSKTQRAIKYVDEIFKKYDKNGDGFLDKDERKNVSVRFKDDDNDKKISRGEALAFVGGGSSSKSSSKTSAKITRSSSNRGSSRDGNSSAGSDSVSVRRELSGFGRIASDPASRGEARDEIRSRGVSSDYFKYDKDQDGQIQMAEFAKPHEWTDKKIAEFDRYDANRDGVITSTEWAAASKSRKK